MDRLKIPYELALQIQAIAQRFRKVPTPSEAILWHAVRGQKLDQRKFRRQHPIGQFIVDFICIREGLIVEVDGPIHTDQAEADAARQALLEALGYRVLRLSADLVETDLPTAIVTIRSMWSDGMPSPPDPLSH
ncbi:endonuclease domain-containing protein [Herpetosiphon llansteffanensis]